MEFKKIVKESFCVIGKEGSTEDGTDFISKLWNETNINFKQIQDLAKKDEIGYLVGIWGAMSDVTHALKPWTNNFSQGLYLAGVECNNDTKASLGWTKWIIPGYEYLCVKCTDLKTFSNTIKYMNDNNIKLVGAVHDYSNPATGEQFMYFPIRKL